jgi:hypothetical protein
MAENCSRRETTLEDDLEAFDLNNSTAAIYAGL